MKHVAKRRLCSSLYDALMLSIVVMIFDDVRTGSTSRRQSHQGRTESTAGSDEHKGTYLLVPSVLLKQVQI